MTTVLVATTNRGKFDEIRAILSSALPAIRWMALFDVDREPPAVHETADSLIGNARIKAFAYARWWGGPALADDSGLFVDALDGAPGVHSARYGGPGTNDHMNREKLLAAMKGIPTDRRTARFSCALTLARPDAIVAEGFGSLEGRIHDREVGDHGFGYDSIVWLDDRRCTFAQMPADEKNAISHRRRALDDLLGKLREKEFA